MQRSGNDILIVGASVRGAAWSAVRSGWSVWGIDQFADLDLQKCATVIPIGHDGEELVELFTRLPHAPWCYTGGMENRPGVLGRLATLRPLWGNGEKVVRQVRDPWRVSAVLREAGLPSLEVWPRSDDRGNRVCPPADGSWVRKPLRGAGGKGIQVWDGAGHAEEMSVEVRGDDDTEQKGNTERAGIHSAGLNLVRGGESEQTGVYFQRRATGVPGSALFLGGAEQETALLLGVTEQLIGVQGVHAAPFGYCGNLLGGECPRACEELLQQMGNLCVTRFGLRGLFGLDFLREGEIPWVTEINPRYTAAMELLEWQLGVPLLRAHGEVCAGREEAGMAALRRARGERSRRATGGDVFGKLVLYAGRDCVARSEGGARDVTRLVHVPMRWGVGTGVQNDDVDGESARVSAVRKDTGGRNWPIVADIPAPGQPLQAGMPVCTLFARGGSARECREKLLRRARRFETRYLEVE